METRGDEVADGICRLSTYVPEADFTFNQFLVDADEPLLFHCGPRRMFPLVSEAQFRATCLTPATAPTIRSPAELEPRTLALMHGPSFNGDCAASLRSLADGYEARLEVA